MAKSKKKTVERKVVYEKPSVKIYGGDKPITADLAKKLLGWQEETEKVKFKEALLVVNAIRIRCTNNVTNRPLYAGVYGTLKQEMLRKRWQLNGEPIIVGKTGLILNGQHTLIALILAAREWEIDPKKWPEWKTEPTIDKLIVCGIDETDNVVNTMDTCKPRSLADVIYRSTYFAGLSANQRSKLSRLADYAIRTLWDRTGAVFSPYAPRRTHSEALDFLARHPKLLECVKHVYEESGSDSNLSDYLSPGAAAGFMYLMAASETDAENYRESLNEKDVDFSRWEKASEFWVLLAGGEASFKPITTALAEIIDEDGTAPRSVQQALIVKAWNCFISGKTITEKRLALEWEKDEYGFRSLVAHPTLGGIDIGDPSDPIEQTQADPSKEAIEAQAETERKQREAKEKAKKKEKEKAAAKETTEPKPKRTAKKKTQTSKITGPLALVGKTMWVKADEPYQAKVLAIHGDDRARVKIATGHPGAGNKRMVAIADLIEKQPPTS